MGGSLMKKNIAFLVMILMLVGATGCSKTETAATNEQIRAVKVEEIQTSAKPVKLNYIGTLDAKEIIEYSFKSGGQIERVLVEKGDHVKKGDKLMQLDRHDLSYQVASARIAMQTAQVNVSKAQDSLTYTQSNLDRMSKLYAENALSKDTYEQLQLQAELEQSAFLQAQSQYESAESTYTYQLSLESDAAIYAEQDGIVVALAHEENERISANTAVISVQSLEEVINIGIPQQDLTNIKVGSKAEIDIDGKKAEGVIANLAEVPDPTTRTYEAEVTVSDKGFRLGSIAQVAIDIGQEKGIWIPIAAILSDGGEDYVYTVKDNRAFKKTIEIIKQAENKVMVKEVHSGEYVAISGMKNLDDGARIKIVK